MAWNIRDLKAEIAYRFWLDKQLLAWLENTGIPLGSLHKIFLNKFIYFTAKEMGVKVGSSWYLYGPYVWRGPIEEQIGFVSLVESLRNRNVKVKVEYDEDESAHRVLDYLGGIYFKELRPPETIFGFLGKIYAEKQEYDELKRFYLQKNATEDAIYQYKNAQLSSSELLKEIKRFQAAILDNKYSQFVSLPVESRLQMIEFYTILENSFENDANKAFQLSAMRYEEEVLSRYLCSLNTLRTTASFSRDDELKHIEKTKKYIKMQTGAFPSEFFSYKTQYFTQAVT